MVFLLPHAWVDGQRGWHLDTILHQSTTVTPIKRCRGDGEGGVKAVPLLPSRFVIITFL